MYYICGVNRLSTGRRAQILIMMVEGLTGAGKNILARLLTEFGSVCEPYHNHAVRNVRVRRLQCDEVWSLDGAKAKNTSPERKAGGWGDTWTWTAIDADSKLCFSYLDLGWAKEFMEDCASRIRGRVQVTTDGHKAYLEAVEGASGMDVDYDCSLAQAAVNPCRQVEKQMIARAIGESTENRNEA